MRVNSWIKGLVVVGSLCPWSWASYAQPQQSSPPQTQDDSLADAARKARAEKKNEPKPKKVYTDDDVKPAQDSAPASAPGQTAKSASDANQEAGTDQAKEDPNSEKAWRARFQKQRDKITKVEKELDVLQRELDKTQVQYYPDPQKAMTEQNTRADVNAVLTKIDDKKKELADLKQAWDDMESDLRKAGGDPGWAR